MCFPFPLLALLFCFLVVRVVVLVAFRLVIRVVASHYCDHQEESHQNHHQDHQNQQKQQKQQKTKQHNKKTLFRSDPDLTLSSYEQLGRRTDIKPTKNKHFRSQTLQRANIGSRHQVTRSASTPYPSLRSTRMAFFKRASRKRRRRPAWAASTPPQLHRTRTSRPSGSSGQASRKS